MKGEHDGISVRFEALFPFDVTNSTLTQIVRGTKKPDQIYWSPSKTGEYTIKSGFF